ncbi:uncharacterized protein LOC114435040 isoform X3 [Parambassis ranga]|uniref:Uncharacterized protein LOC114435040 isoform X1 n=1 Tax=Parambassis ranga TaxID=210632 RepID=A0A6P7HXF3_9TELE|nr:uncharacterized protein LOC114435040 isoform X1 [Parambassis ranga]XP_028260355.1 uncharacterized protein LOC114435040 isoform X3 [Parambassis ranga]
MARGHHRNLGQPMRREQLRQRQADRNVPTTAVRLLSMIVSSVLPLDLTEDKNFLSFVNELNSSELIPPMSLIHLLLHEAYNKKKEELRHTLSSTEDVVLTCELWSSGPGDSFLSVACHLVDRFGKLKSFMLKTTSLFGDESAANIQTQLSAIMEAWSLTGKVHSVVRAGMPQLKDVKTKWMHMPCFADTLNGVCKDLMQDAELQGVLRKCQNIVQFFKYDPEAERELQDSRVCRDLPQYQLVLYTGHCLLAWLDVLQQLVPQDNLMATVLTKRGKMELILNEDETQRIQKLVSALKPLKEVTSAMDSKGFQTISVMLPLLMKLMGTLQEESKRKNVIAQQLLHKCRRQFGDVNKNYLAPFTFLDPRFKDQLGDKNRKLATQKIIEELAAGAPSSTRRIQAVLDQYMAYKPTAHTSNPLAWWRNTGKQRFGELSRLALKKLCVVSTVVPLERAFSSAGERFNDRRSSIEAENLNKILFLHGNSC